VYLRPLDSQFKACSPSPQAQVLFATPFNPLLPFVISSGPRISGRLRQIGRDLIPMLTARGEITGNLELLVIGLHLGTRINMINHRQSSFSPNQTDNHPAVLNSTPTNSLRPHRKPSWDRPSSTDTISHSFEMTVLLNLLKFYLSVPLVMFSSSLVGYISPAPAVRFWSRALTCYCSLVLCATYGVIASVLLRIIGRPTLAQWATARSFSVLTGPLIGWKWDIEGEEILMNNRPAVFISNHQR
jgi:hypothetical protein